MLKGRLGLETARIPHADRHGLVWLSRCKVYVDDGTVRFSTPGFGELDPGDYALPYQTVSTRLLGPGSTISHDALRLLARHGTALVAVGQDGVRFYASMPFGSDSSALARRQVERWANEEKRISIARRMYAWRLGKILPHTEIAVLRGIEGKRVKELYRHLAQQYGLEWKRRRYDRNDPEAADRPNQAINHAATAVQAAAMIAVAATSTIPQLGFIHEASGKAFCLDIADLYRDSVTLPCAFQAVLQHDKRPDLALEHHTRKLTGTALQRQKIIPAMITRIKELFDADDGSCDP